MVIIGRLKRNKAADNVACFHGIGGKERMQRKSFELENRSKESVGLAGEYAVASELCRRGHYAQLTLGHHKKTDLLVEIKSEASGLIFRRVSVKSKAGYAWPKVTGIWERGDVLIFVDFKGKQENKRPDFYVLDVEAWKKVVKLKLKQPKNKGSKMDKTNTLYWESWEENDKGWRGCQVRAEELTNCKEEWKNVDK
jgi:hypothetical protein